MPIARDIVYDPGRESRSRYDLYTPEGPELHPLMIFFYGGGLVAGRKEDLAGMGEEFSRAGVAVAAPDYRLFPEAAWPAFIQDAARAVAAVVERAPVGTPILIGGYSAGCYLAMMLCFDPQYLGAHGLRARDFAGFVLLSGQPTDHYEVLSRRGVDPRRVMVSEQSALYHVDGPEGPPLLLISSDSDMPGRLAQNQLLLATLDHFGYAAPHSLTVVPGVGHGEFLNPDPTGHSHLFTAAMPFIRAACKEATP